MENEQNLDLELNKNEENPIEPIISDEPQEEVITLSKKDYQKLNRKAIAYDSTKQAPITKTKPRELDDDIVKTVQELKTIENKRQFGFDHGLSPEETDAVFKFANGNPTKETLDHPFIKAGIDSLRSAKRVEANTPSSSQRSSVFGGKSFVEMSEEDRAKAFEAKMKSLQ